MSDSTIDDALRLLEIGKGSQDRLKQIIETFEKRSLIPLQDRKYVEALVQQYLTPRHRIKIKKIEPIKKQPTISPRTLKSTEPEFSFEKNANTSDNKKDLEELDGQTNRTCPECGSQNSTVNNFCNNCGSRITKSDIDATKSETSSIIKNENEFERYEREYLERKSEKTNESAKETSFEEKSVEYIVAKPNESKKSNKKFIGIAIGIIVVIIIAGGASLMAGNTDFSSTSQTEERITCDSNVMLVSSTKIPGFPDPEKDLQYYLDRYNNESNYKDWFDRNFPDQTIQSVVCS